MKRQNKTLIVLAIWTLVNVAVLVVLRTQTEASGEPEVYRVGAAVTVEQPGPAETARINAPDPSERDKAEDSAGGGAGGGAEDGSAESAPIETESDCTDEPRDASDTEDDPAMPFSASGAPAQEAPLPTAPSQEEGLAGGTEHIDGAAPVFTYTEQDVHDLAVAVYREAGDASERAKLLVANVVVNHVASPDFPDTIHGVLTVPYHYGTMAWDGVEFPEDADPELVERCYEVARRVLSGERLCPANVIGQAEFIQGTGVYEYIDGIYFCYY